jgi:hypothetical protein
MKNNCSRFVVLCCCLCSACATVPVNPPDGPPLGSIFEDNQLSIKLTVVNQLVDAHSTCELSFTFTNNSQIELEPNFEMSLVTQTGYTLDQGALGFPTVMPGQSVNGGKSVYMVGCSNIASIHFSRIK